MAKEKMNLPKFYDFVEKVAYAGVVVSGLIGFFYLYIGLVNLTRDFLGGLINIVFAFLYVLSSLFVLGLIDCFLSIVSAVIDIRNKMYDLE